MSFLIDGNMYIFGLYQVRTVDAHVFLDAGGTWFSLCFAQFVLWWYFLIRGLKLFMNLYR